MSTACLINNGLAHGGKAVVHPALQLCLPAAQPGGATLITVRNSDGSIKHSRALSTTTHNNAEGAALIATQKELISQLSATLESKSVSINERNLTSTAWTEYSGSTKRLQKQTEPTSNITAEYQSFSTIQPNILCRNFIHDAITRPVPDLITNYSAPPSRWMQQRPHGRAPLRQACLS